jgi:GTPase SAR1 family protein
MNSKKQKKHKVKIAMFGDTGAGKSTLLNSYMQSSGDKEVIQSKF